MSLTPEILTARREALGISRVKLAELAVMSPYQLSNVEISRRQLTPLEQRRLEHVLSRLEACQAEIRAAMIRPPTPTSVAS